MSGPPAMSAAGYRARVYAVEWHGNLWRLNGVPSDRCEEMIRYCTECVDADFFGDQRPTTDDAEIAKMCAYLDRLFQEPPERFPPGTSFI